MFLKCDWQEERKKGNFGLVHFAAYVINTLSTGGGLPATKSLKNKAKDPSSSLKTMGRQSKATISRLSNLQKSKNTHIPTFNDVFDEEDTNSDDEDFPDHDVPIVQI